MKAGFSDVLFSDPVALFCLENTLAQSCSVGDRSLRYLLPCLLSHLVMLPGQWLTELQLFWGDSGGGGGSG